MFCPNCKKNILLIMEYENIELDFCPDCLGVWLDAEELQWILESQFDERSIFTKNTVDETKKKCPRCQTYMQKVSLPQNDKIVYDICPENHGIWFDRGELENLIQNLPEFPGALSFLQWLKTIFHYQSGQEK